MPSPELTLPELEAYWLRIRSEADDALKHIRALMRLQTVTIRKLEAKHPTRGRKKPKLKPTAEDHILKVVAEAEGPLTSAEITHGLQAITGKKYSRQGVNFAVNKLVKEQRLIRSEAPEGSASGFVYEIGQTA